MKWYALYTFAGQELNIKKQIELLVERDGLQDQIEEVFVPMQEVVTISGGRRKSSNKRIFSSYVLIHMDMSKELMHRLSDIPGVMNFLGVNGKPTPLRQEEVDRTKGKPTPEGEALQTVVEIPYKVGEVVRIKEGPFKSFDGNVEEIDPDKGRLTVMVSVFGRSTPVQVSYAQVEGL